MLSGPTVLIIEDELDLAEILRVELQELNYNVLVADSLAAALPLLKTNNVSLVLSDINMPGQQGTELMKYRKEFLTPQTTIFFMTGSTVSEKQVLDLGAQGLIRKPFSLDSLGQLVKTLIP